VCSSDLEGYLAEYQLRTLFAHVSEERAARVKDKAQAEKLKEQARQQYRLAAEVLIRFRPRDPAEAQVHYDLAEALFKSGDEAAAREEAREALRLDALATLPTRKLTDRQHQTAEGWLRGATDG